VGRLVVLADVRLELDDPARPPDRAVITDQRAAEQGPTELDRWQREDVANGCRYFGPTVT
jgi:hypothetical protein